VADTQFYTVDAAVTKATAIKTALALSKLRLFQAPFTPSTFSTKAQLVAAEATFDGYPTGGYALTAWTGPTVPDGGGALITSPLVNINYGPADDPPVTNQIAGWWVEDAAGNVRLVGIFNPARPEAVVGDGFAFVIQIVEGRTITTG